MAEDGVVAQGQAGSVGLTVIISLSGVDGSGEVGTVSVVHGPALTGVLASGAVGSIAEVIRTHNLSGVQARGSAGLVGALYWGLFNNYQNPQWDLVVTE